MDSSWYKLDNSLPGIGADTLFTSEYFSVSNSITTGILTTLILVIFTLIISAKFRKATSDTISGLQIVLEMFYTALEDFINQITGDMNITRKLLPMILSLFVYILLSNVITIFPPFNFLSVEGSDGNTYDLFVTHTSDVSVTFGIGAGLIIASHVAGIRYSGIIGYIDKYIPIFTFLKDTYNAPKQILVNLLSFLFNLFMGLLDLVGEMGKSISLSFRLFGNMFAGDLMMKFILGSFAILIPAVWGMYGLISGVLQAIVFTALVSSYFTSQMQSE